MPKWVVHHEAGQWLAWEEGDRKATEWPFSSWRSAWAYALVRANPAAEVVR